MNLINRTPSNWYESKWPYPKVSYVRNHATFTDSQGRFFLRVSQADQEYIELPTKPGALWYWVAHPAREVVDSVQQPDKITAQSPYMYTYSVLDTALIGIPRRKLYLALLR